jgi:hypothetical protein
MKNINRKSAAVCGFIFVCLAALVLMTAHSTKAATGGDPVADKYGAIAFSTSTRSYGYSYNYATQNEAIARAIDECNARVPGRDCQMLVWFRNACGALAVGDTGYGSAWAADRFTAERIAIENCSKHSANCQVLRWVCTDK